MNNNAYGATPSEWDHFSLVLGLTKDLLPVVSNPNAKISAQSKMKGVGKTPSRYTNHKEVVGIAGWTDYQATQADIAKWSTQPDYGICLQTREVRAIDVDVADQATASRVWEFIEQRGIVLPCRMRSNSGKFLLAFQLAGDLPKRVIRMGEAGIIEMLASGQQFVACGQHTSGVRYDWIGGLPDDIPSLTLDQFESLWTALATEFGSGESTTTSPSKTKVLQAAISNDPDAVFLVENGWVKSQERDGRLHITCPFEAEHTTESAVSATTYFPANTGGYQFGHYDCRHAHCEHRTDQDFRDAIGVPQEDVFADFDVLPADMQNRMTGTGTGTGTGATIEGDFEVLPTDGQAEKPKRKFEFVPAHQFAAGNPPGWWVKGVLPKAALGVVYGESGSGKTFWLWDMTCCVAMGSPWRGLKVDQGKVAYVVAEGAGGMRSRVAAYASDKGVDPAELGAQVGILADAPNMMEVADVKELVHAIRDMGGVKIVVIDTMAQTMAGANENSGEDVGRVLKHCREIYKHTGALVLLVHHAGKDTSKGARGWSGLRAACDVEIEVARCDDDRVATVTKLKDGRDGQEFGFKLQTVVVDIDEDNEEITSCVIEHVEGGASRSEMGGRGKKKSDPVEGMVLRSLGELIGLGDGRAAYTDVVRAVVDRMVPGATDRRNYLVTKAINDLSAKGLLLVDRGFLLLKEEAAGD